MVGQVKLIFLGFVICYKTVKIRNKGALVLPHPNQAPTQSQTPSHPGQKMSKYKKSPKIHISNFRTFCIFLSTSIVVVDRVLPPSLMHFERHY